MIYHDTTAIDAVNEGRDVPDAFYHPKRPSELIARSHHVSVDGWRGYHELTPEPGYKKIEADWLTGDWDDAPEGHRESEVSHRVEKLAQQYGEVFVVFTPTSNVFSTSYSVIVRDPDAGKVNKGVVVGHKTRKFTDPDGSWRVRYHATDVVSYDAKTGKYKLDTGGWNTMTTSKRMTEHLPGGYYVYRKNWVMYVHTPAGDKELTDGIEV
jgi:hypothetical protein